MGTAEVLLHTHDIAEGLGLTYQPDPELAEFVLTRIFPHVRPGASPWLTLLWATGRGDLPGRDPVTDWRWHNNLVHDTDRLTLQGITPASATDLVGGGDGGFEWIEGGPYTGTREAATFLLKAYQSGVHRPEFGVFTLVRREDGRAVGGLGFHGVPDEEGRVEIGYDLAAGARGHGYATEALRALSAWALARDDVRTVFATIERGQPRVTGGRHPGGLQEGERGRGGGRVRLRVAPPPVTPLPRAPLGPPQPRRGQQPHHLTAPHLHRPRGHRVRVTMRRDVVVIALEGPARHAQLLGEQVEFVVRDIADEVRPEAAVPRPGGRVDVDGHREPRFPTAATFTPAWWQTQCGSGPSSGSTSRACGSPAAQTGQSGQRPYASSSASCTSWATSPAT